MQQHFAVAPWPTSLKVVSILSTIVLMGLGIAAYRAIPTPTGFTHAFGLGIACIFPIILAVSLLFIVSGYALKDSNLLIIRPLWSTQISLSGLRLVFAEPKVCKGSIRLFGNAGLFSFTGLYQNSTLGRYRLFATNLSRAVVLVLPNGTIVVTPASPKAFIDAVRRAHPGATEDRA